MLLICLITLSSVIASSINEQASSETQVLPEFVVSATEPKENGEQSSGPIAGNIGYDDAGEELSGRVGVRVKRFFLPIPLGFPSLFPAPWLRAPVPPFPSVPAPPFPSVPVPPFPRVPGSYYSK